MLERERAFVCVIVCPPVIGFRRSEHEHVLRGVFERWREFGGLGVLTCFWPRKHAAGRTPIYLYRPAPAVGQSALLSTRQKSPWPRITTSAMIRQLAIPTELPFHRPRHLRRLHCCPVVQRLHRARRRRHLLDATRTSVAHAILTVRSGRGSVGNAAAPCASRACPPRRRHRLRHGLRLHHRRCHTHRRRIYPASPR